MNQYSGEREKKEKALLIVMEAKTTWFKWWMLNRHIQNTGDGISILIELYMNLHHFFFMKQSQFIGSDSALGLYTEISRLRGQLPSYLL
jgi:hypothetical protein